MKPCQELSLTLPLEAQMHRWDLGGRPDLLPENEDGGQDIELENICKQV